MMETVKNHRADCGVAFDGDADRAIFADDKGRLLDGDGLIALSAMRLHDARLLRKETVVLTVMSNFGIKSCLEARGLRIESVPVGDRNVTEAIERGGFSLGGENSGHIIFRRFAVTGDGLLTALQTFAAIQETGKSLSALRRGFRPTPQILENLRIEKKVPLAKLPRVGRVLKEIERKLTGKGRVFVRYSGTEPLLRIMLEGPNLSLLRRMAQKISSVYIEETRQQLVK